MAHSRISPLAVSVLICGTLMTLALTPFAAAGKPGVESFDGECELSGIIRHQPPLTQEPASTRIHGSFSGVCSGVFTDRDGQTYQLDAAPASYDGRGTGELSCLGGVATGTGKLVFARGRQIDFRLTERRAPGVAVVTLQGEAGGSAVVVGTVSRSEDLAELNERCNGSGVRSLRGDAHLVSPGIAG